MTAPPGGTVTVWMPRQRRAEDAAQIINFVEHFADDVERGGEIRAADAEEDAHRLADLGVQRMQLGQGADRTVEDEIFRPLAQQFLDTELLAAVLAERRFGVDLALHDVKFVVDRRQPFLGLDQDQPVHAVGDVLGHHRRGAVVNVKPGDQRLECHRLLFAGIDLQRGSAAARPGRRMEIDRVDHRAVGGILQVDVNGVADADAQEWPGTLPLKVQ